MDAQQPLPPEIQRRVDVLNNMLGPTKLKVNVLKGRLYDIDAIFILAEDVLNLNPEDAELNGLKNLVIDQMVNNVDLMNRRIGLSQEALDQLSDDFRNNVDLEEAVIFFWEPIIRIEKARQYVEDLINRNGNGNHNREERV